MKSMQIIRSGQAVELEDAIAFYQFPSSDRRCPYTFHKHGIRLKDVNYVQIHPTTFYSKNQEDAVFLFRSLSAEKVRFFLTRRRKRFVNELLPRDVVTKQSEKQMAKDGTDHVWLSMETIGKETIMGHFPNIVQHCLEMGYDVTKECIPVVPAQHYFMGGVWVDSATVKHPWNICMRWGDVTL